MPARCKMPGAKCQVQSARALLATRGARWVPAGGLPACHPAAVNMQVLITKTPKYPPKKIQTIALASWTTSCWWGKQTVQSRDAISHSRSTTDAGSTMPTKYGAQRSSFATLVWPNSVGAAISCRSTTNRYQRLQLLFFFCPQRR